VQLQKFPGSLQQKRRFVALFGGGFAARSGATGEFLKPPYNFVQSAEIV
jgi:hypothetical protein